MLRFGTVLLTSLLLFAAPAWADDADAPAVAANAKPEGIRPVVEMVHLLETSALTLVRPFARPKLEDLWVWVPATALTVAFMVEDVPLYHFVHDRFPDPRLFGQRLSYWGSYLGEWYVDGALIAVLGLVGGAQGQRACRAGLAALIATGAFSRTLKLIFRLDRPSSDGNEKHWFGQWNADSFPSGHAMTAFATASVLAVSYPLLAPLFYALAAYVGVARVQESTHWPSDVIVGTACGLLFGWSAAKLEGKAELVPIVNPRMQGLALAGRF